MNIDESLFNTGPYFHGPLKRKRYLHYENNLNSEDDDGSNDGSDSANSCNSNASLSPFVNIVRHGHKVLITQKKNSNSNSQIEVDMDNLDSPISSIEQEEDNGEFNLSSDEEVSSECDNSFVFSDALKTKLQELNSEDDLMTRLKSDADFYPNSNDLQIIPWIPNIPQSEEYDVEEPNEETHLNRNKPFIEEVCSSDNLVKNSKSNAKALSNFYLVEHEDDYKNFDCFLDKNCSRYNITELENHSLGQVEIQIDEESMEF
ncbi:hypothetical protein BpHYR1_037230 [Brachionus plicatilis]|uniref:Uncharacterized protein n=1 Tax=Brachionus plicatilis TaxID=10195 RepID=A0A3M7PSZ0_BRAPC|nr:hypothetical protein BpHYR1_037230 [Brachionus plicatilis]